MASPQPTPFVRFSKELFEAFYMNPPATVAGCRLWLWVLRWTWADFEKAETKERSLSEIAREVGLSKTGTYRELQSLLRCKRLKTGPNGGYAIQKDYDLWSEDPQKRTDNITNRMRQATLFTPVDNLGITSETVPNVGTRPFPPVERNRSHVGNNSVPTLGTPIRIETTRENREKDPQPLPNGKTDTPTARAELGHWEFAPQDHPGFTRLSFKLQDTLADQWRTNAEAKRKANACKSGCGRPKATAAWPYCRPCTVCSTCNGGADGERRFTVSAGEIRCNDCKEKKT